MEAAQEIIGVLFVLGIGFLIGWGVKTWLVNRIVGGK
jgi:uncharacterized membrane protein